MKKKKLTLEDLKVESFTTSLDSSESQRIYGGDSGTNTADSPLPCTMNCGGGDPFPPNPPDDPTQLTVKCNTTSDCPPPNPPSDPTPPPPPPPTTPPPVTPVPPPSRGTLVVGSQYRQCIQPQ